MKGRQLFVIIGSLSLIIFFGWLMVESLNDGCISLRQKECYLLWGAAMTTIIGGALVIETWVARKKARGEWQVRIGDSHSEGPVLSSSQVWFRSMARVVLASLLVSLPIIVQGAFVVTLSGTIVGVSLAFLRHGIMNDLPPIEEGTKT
jgi:hypothetical protein